MRYKIGPHICPNCHHWLLINRFKKEVEDDCTIITPEDSRSNPGVLDMDVDNEYENDGWKNWSRRDLIREIRALRNQLKNSGPLKKKGWYEL